MLTIRSAQMKVLSQALSIGTDDRALKHLQHCLPEVCARMGEPALYDTIRWARQRSQQHGIDSELDFFRYLNLMFMFGFKFDVDPQYPWASSTLRSARPCAVKMDLLMDHALLFCSRQVSPQAA